MNCIERVVMPCLLGSICKAYEPRHLPLNKLEIIPMLVAGDIIAYLPRCTAQEFNRRATQSPGTLYYEGFGEWLPNGKKPLFEDKNGDILNPYTTSAGFGPMHNKFNAIIAYRHNGKPAQLRIRIGDESKTLDFYDPTIEFDLFCENQVYDGAVLEIHDSINNACSGILEDLNVRESEYAEINKKVIEWLQDPSNHDDLERVLRMGSNFRAAHYVRVIALALQCLFVKAGIIDGVLNELINSFYINIDFGSDLSKTEKANLMNELYDLLQIPAENRGFQLKSRSSMSCMSVIDGVRCWFRHSS